MNYTDNQVQVVKEVIKALDGEIKPQHRVIKILAPTGYGKTSIIPMTITTAILRGERMLVLFPNVTAVRKMYAYLKEFEALMGGSLRVGYAAASEIEYGLDHNLVLATYGHGYRLAVNALRIYHTNLKGTTGRVDPNSRALLQFNSIVFDEYHNAAKEVPMVASIYRFLMSTLNDSDKSKRASTKIHRAFFMTATDIHALPGGMDSFSQRQKKEVRLGSEDESRYTTVYRPPPQVRIGDPSVNIPTKLQSGRAKLKGKDLRLTHILTGMVAVIDEVLRMGQGGTATSQSTQSGRSRLISLLREQSNPKTDATDPLPSHHANTPIRYNNVLVFLPGKREIQFVHERISKSANVEVIEFHSKSPNETTRILQTAPREGVKRIILATNIVESSVTIDYLDVVIDSLLEKTVVHDPELGAKRLVLQYISKNSSKQRAGRVGRNRVGVAIKIAGEEDYNSLLQSKPNSITTENISKLVADIVANAHGNSRNILDKAGVTDERRAEAIEEIVKLGVFRREGGSYTLNVPGVELALISRLPLDLRSSVFIHRWLSAEYPPYPGIIIAAIWDMNTRYMNVEDYPNSVEDFLKDYQLNHDTLIGESINLWKYIVKTIETINLSEDAIRRTFSQDGIPLVDESEFKRLSNVIYECVRAVTDHLKDQLRRENDELKTQLQLFQREDNKNKVEEIKQRLTDVRRLFQKPVLIGEFSTDDAIRGLGYIAEVGMRLDNIGTISRIGNRTVIRDQSGITYNINQTVSKMMKLKSNRKYLIIGTFAIGNNNIATNIIPTYSEMDAISRRRDRPTRNLSRTPYDDDDSVEEEEFDRRGDTRNRNTRTPYDDDDSVEEEEFNRRRDTRNTRTPYNDDDSVEEEFQVEEEFDRRRDTRNTRTPYDDDDSVEEEFQVEEEFDRRRDIRNTRTPYDDDDSVEEEEFDRRRDTRNTRTPYDDDYSVVEEESEVTDHQSESEESQVEEESEVTDHQSESEESQVEEELGEESEVTDHQSDSEESQVEEESEAIDDDDDDELPEY